MKQIYLTLVFCLGVNAFKIDIVPINPKVYNFYMNDYTINSTLSFTDAYSIQQRECELVNGIVFLHKPESTVDKPLCYGPRDMVAKDGLTKIYDLENQESRNKYVNTSEITYFRHHDNLSRNMTLGVIKGKPCIIQNQDINEQCKFTQVGFLGTVTSNICIFVVRQGVMFCTNSGCSYSNQIDQVRTLVKDDKYTCSSGVGQNLVVVTTVALDYQQSSVIEIVATFSEIETIYFNNDLVTGKRYPVGYPISQKLYNPQFNYQPTSDLLYKLDHTSIGHNIDTRKRRNVETEDCYHEIEVVCATTPSGKTTRFFSCYYRDEGYINCDYIVQQYGYKDWDPAQDLMDTLCRSYDSVCNVLDEDNVDLDTTGNWDRWKYFWVPAAVDPVAAASIGSAFAATWRLATDVSRGFDTVNSEFLSIAGHINDAYDEIAANRKEIAYFWQNIQNLQWHVNKVNVGVTQNALAISSLRNEMFQQRKLNLYLINEVKRPIQAACNKTEIENAYLNETKNANKTITSIICENDFAFISYYFKTPLFVTNPELGYIEYHDLSMYANLYGKFHAFCGSNCEPIMTYNPTVNYGTTLVYILTEKLGQEQIDNIKFLSKHSLIKACTKNKYFCVLNTEGDFWSQELVKNDKRPSEAQGILKKLGIDNTMTTDRNFFTLNCKEPTKNVTYLNLTKEIEIMPNARKLCNRAMKTEELLASAKELEEREYNPNFALQGDWEGLPFEAILKGTADSFRAVGKEAWGLTKDAAGGIKEIADEVLDQFSVFSGPFLKILMLVLGLFIGVPLVGVLGYLGYRFLWPKCPCRNHAPAT